MSSGCSHWQKVSTVGTTGSPLSLTNLCASGHEYSMCVPYLVLLTLQNRSKSFSTSSHLLSSESEGNNLKKYIFLYPFLSFLATRMKENSSVRIIFLTFLGRAYRSKLSIMWRRSLHGSKLELAVWNFVSIHPNCKWCNRPHMTNNAFILIILSEMCSLSAYVRLPSLLYSKILKVAVVYYFCEFSLRFYMHLGAKNSVGQPSRAEI